MPKSRSDVTDGHILIGGTGRAGTTLLVQYFTALGFDTGFTLEETTSKVNAISRGGLEHALGHLEQGLELPYVVKSAWLGQRLGDYLARGDISVKACIVPMRSLFEAAESRRSVSRRAADAGLNPDRHPGGIINARRNRQNAQERMLATSFYNLMLALASHEIPVHLLRFPDFATGQQSLFRALGPLLVEHGVTEEESQEAFGRVVQVDLIHSFEDPS
jgi:hypothetical protein